MLSASLTWRHSDGFQEQSLAMTSGLSSTICVGDIGSFMFSASLTWKLSDGFQEQSLATTTVRMGRNCLAGTMMVKIVIG